MVADESVPIVEIEAAKYRMREAIGAEIAVAVLLNKSQGSLAGKRNRLIRRTAIADSFGRRCDRGTDFSAAPQRQDERQMDFLQQGHGVRGFVQRLSATRDDRFFDYRDMTDHF